MKVLRALLLVAAQLIWLNPHEALAHKPSDSYLRVEEQAGKVTARWDIALRDLELPLRLDTDGDGNITWGEIESREQELSTFALSRLAILQKEMACDKAAKPLQVDSHSDGVYAVLDFEIHCPQAISSDLPLTLSYSLLFDFDTQHRGLLSYLSNGSLQTGIFAPTLQSIALGGTPPSKFTAFIEFVRHGVWHIWIGADHILFLISLLLPAVLRRSMKDAVVDVLAIVTAFTFSHSITLGLAAFEILSLPSRLVESTIALSVLLAAFNNVFPLLTKERWTMAFIFGFIHGFGFASVLSDLGLRQGSLALLLFGFNLGVELGQLSIVALVIPLAYCIRESIFYRRAVVMGGSCAICAIAAIWFVERAFLLSIL